MTTTYTLTQLVDAANAQLTAEGIEPTVTERLVRHYTSEKKVLPVPEKAGREARYTEEHLEKLVRLRRAQKMGITAQAFDSADKYSTSVTAASSVYMAATPASSPSFSTAMESAKGLTGNAVQASESLFSRSALMASSASLSNTSTSPQQESALSFLRGLDSKPQDAALLNQVSQLVQSPVANASNAPDNWLHWDVLPGVQLQMKSTTYAAFGAAEERALIDAIRTIRKTKP